MQKNNKIDDDLLSEEAKQKNFNIFFIKFVGYLISKGKKSKAINNYDNIIYMLKKRYKYFNIINILYKFFLALYPIFSVKYRRFGKTYQPIPRLARGNIKNVLIFDWFLKSLKGKSNVRGINMSDVVNVISDTFEKKRSKALLNKNYFYKRVLLGRHFLKNVRRRKRSSRRRIRREN